MTDEAPPDVTLQVAAVGGADTAANLDPISTNVFEVER